MIEAFTSLEKAAKRINLHINQQQIYASNLSYLEVDSTNCKLSTVSLTHGQLLTVIMILVQKSKNTPCLQTGVFMD
jgi:hypothetical protein